MPKPRRPCGIIGIVSGLVLTLCFVSLVHMALVYQSLQDTSETMMGPSLGSSAVARASEQRGVDLEHQVDSGKNGKNDSMETVGSAGKPPLIRKLTFHIPPYHNYDCREEKLPNTGYTGLKTCGPLHPLPKQHPSRLSYCGPEFKTYATHYYYFAHAMFLQKELWRRANVTMEAVEDPYLADIVLCRADKSLRFVEELHNSSVRHRPLLILVEEHDAGTMMAPKSVIEDPYTVAALKHYSWKNHGGNCPGKDRRDYRHITLLRLLENGAQLPPGPLRPEVADKLVEDQGCERWGNSVEKKFRIIYPHWNTVRRGQVFPPVKDLVPIRRRKIDIAFAGTLNYSEFGQNQYWQQQASRHRIFIMEKLRALCARHNWNVEYYTSALKKAEFYNLLKRTKIFISPWGIGEWSGKDEESMLFGAVLLKIGAGLFDSSIPLYKVGEMCLEARPDGADLEDVLVEALAPENTHRLEKMQIHTHAVVSAYASYGYAVRHPDVLGDWTALILEITDALRSHDSEPPST